MRKMRIIVFVAMALAIALPLRAQSGCTDSPEDPTAILAVLAGAAACIAHRWPPRRP